MTIFLYGPDDYRREAKKQEIISEFKRKHSALGVGVFDFGEVGESDNQNRDPEVLLRFRDFAGNQSIFETVKLAVLGGLDAAAAEDLATEIKSYSKNPNFILLVSARGKLSEKWSFLWRDKDARVQEFPQLHGAAWRVFVRQEAARWGVKFAPSALEFLVAAREGDSWRLITDLQKLSLFPRSPVRREDLERLDIESTPDFWQTLLGFKSSHLGRRLATLEKILASGEPAAKVFNILSARWPEKLPQFAKYDLEVKSGRCDYEEALVDLLMS